MRMVPRAFFGGRGNWWGTKNVLRGEVRVIDRRAETRARECERLLRLVLVF